MVREEVRYELFGEEKPDILLVAYGSMARICREVINKFPEKRKKISLLRPISLWPFPYEVTQKLSKEVKFVFVVEMSEGQMLQDVKLAIRERKVSVHFYGRMGGGVPTPLKVMEEILKYED
jgi:2-oxoglutarate ferredoxin oxidoreductase subunit alpha